MYYFLGFIIISINLVFGQGGFWLPNHFEVPPSHPFLQDSQFPPHYNQCIQNFNMGRYRQALHGFKAIEELHLPDPYADFVQWMIAECYRKMDAGGMAEKKYLSMLQRFPQGHFKGLAYFRLLIQYYDQDRYENALSCFLKIKELYRNATFYEEAAYTIAKFQYKRKNYEAALQSLETFGEGSPYYLQALFLKGLIYIDLDQTVKALFNLQFVEEKTAHSSELHAECLILQGDIYYQQKKYAVAKNKYQLVPSLSSRFDRILFKLANITYEEKNYEKCIRLGNQIIQEIPDSRYVFEICLLLEKCYRKLNRKEEIRRVERFFLAYLRSNKLIKEIYTEIAELQYFQDQWLIFNDAYPQNKNRYVAHLHKSNAMIDSLNMLLERIDPSQKRRKSIPFVNTGERKYYSILKENEKKLKKQIQNKNEILTKLLSQRDSLETRKLSTAQIDTLIVNVNTLIYLHQMRLNNNLENQKIILTQVFKGEEESQLSEELKFKLIDLTFLKKSDKEEQLKKVYEEIADIKRRLSNP